MSEQTDAEEKTIEEVYQERNLLALAFIGQYELYHSAAYGKEVEMGYWYDEDAPESGGDDFEWVVVWVNTVEGQVGWHVPDNMLPPWLEERDPEYSGYSTDEKNNRVARLADLSPERLGHEDDGPE